MKVGNVSMKFAYAAIGALTLVGAAPSRALAQHDHGAMVQAQTAEQSRQQAALVQAVREATERYRDPAAAEAAGYPLAFGCVGRGDFGALGLQLGNME